MRKEPFAAMRLITKTTLFSTVLTLVLLFALIGVSLLSFRQFSIISARAHTRTAAEIVRVTLTEQMVNGVIDKRENFLSRLAEVQGLLSARVIRGPQVAAQFGAGLAREQPLDAVEQRVFESGEPFSELIEDQGEPVFRSTIPFIADDRGTPNCLQCHQVAKGSVLGAVTLIVSISHLKSSALETIGLMVGTVGFFGLLTVLFMRRVSRPLVTTAEGVKAAVGDAIQGKFTTKVESRTNDELGQIAQEVNQLTAFLHRGLATIRDNVAQLLHTRTSQDANLLTTTMEMVEGLIDAAHFKQSIEEDETKREVYERLARVLREDFGLCRYTIFEVSASKNRMVPVTTSEGDEESCNWCDKQVLIRSETCRARRTGHMVDSLETPYICNAFRPGEKDGRLHHICLPIIQSGAVGSVVQLVVTREDGGNLKEEMPFLNVYLREAAPVIEAKRLMDTLRESNLRDPMTGLHNRRFLEEYVDTLVAASSRRKSQISILMADVDYFKKVNDTYGHDAGDTVLKAVAKTLHRSVRSSDLVIRYGGEEFLVILQDSANNYADDVAEKIRQMVEETTVQLPGITLTKTISIGVADFPTDSDTFWQAVKFADVALYKAKEQGRNRIIHFKPEMWTSEQY